MKISRIIVNSQTIFCNMNFKYLRHSEMEVKVIIVTCYSFSINWKPEDNKFLMANMWKKSHRF